MKPLRPPLAAGGADEVLREDVEGTPHDARKDAIGRAELASVGRTRLAILRPRTARCAATREDERQDRRASTGSEPTSS